MFASALPTLCPTREFPSTFLVGRPLGNWGNRASYSVLDMLLGPIRRTRDLWRRDRLGLEGPSAGQLRGPDGRPFLHLHGHSETVLPTPGDWEPEWKTVGYWTLPPPDGWVPPTELTSFLEAGPPPVYVGFGSMTHPRTTELTRAVVDGVLATGARLLLARGSGALAPREVAARGEGSRVLALDGWEGVPHEWLLPRVAVVIHHGGPGTLGAAVRAGRPQVCCPFGMDQPFWAGRARLLGVSPPPLPVRRLTAVRLAARVRDIVTDARYRERAEALGRRVRTEEDGTSRAVTEIEALAGSPATRTAASPPRIARTPSRPLQ